MTDTLEQRRAKSFFNVDRIGKNLVGVGGFLLIVVVYFGLTTDKFLSFSNFGNIIATACVIGIVSIGQTFALVAGGFDLSVGGVLPLGAISFATLSNAGFSVTTASMLAMCVGLLAGLINATIIYVIGINPLIATLATWSIFGGLAFTITGGMTIPVNDLDAGPLNTRVAGLPLYAWLTIGLAIISFVVLRFTVYGRLLYALGGNRDATWLAGARVGLLGVSIYVICGLLASLAGVVLAQQLLAGAPTVGGDAALDSITAVVLGGAALSGGLGGIGGTVLGVLVLGTVENGMALQQIPSFYQQIATGAILLLAVGLGELKKINYPRRKHRRHHI